MPKPITPNTIRKHPDYTAKTAPKKGAGKRVQASKSPSPKAAQQTLPTTASKFRPKASLQRKAGEMPVYRTKGTAPLPQYAGLSKKEFTLLKDFLLDAKQCQPKDAEEFIAHALLNINQLNVFHGKTLFYYTLLHNRLDLAKLLIDKCGANPNIPNASNTTPIEDFVRYKNGLNQVKFLISNGVNVNDRVEVPPYGIGTTLLMLAVRTQCWTIVECLVKEGHAHPLAEDEMNTPFKTPLEWAIVHNAPLDTLDALIGSLDLSQPEMEAWHEQLSNTLFEIKWGIQGYNEKTEEEKSRARHIIKQFLRQGLKVPESYHDHPLFTEANLEVNRRYQRTKSARNG
jgi:hypothetical protein